MSHFTFENMISECTRMDGPIRQQNTWRRKPTAAMENLHKNIAAGMSPARAARTPNPDTLTIPCKTPKTAKTPNTATPGRSQQGRWKTPSKSPGRGGLQENKMQLPYQQAGRWKTPSKTPNKGLNAGQQDRFIPNRAMTDIDAAHFTLMVPDADGAAAQGSQSDVQYQNHLSEALNKQTVKDAKILSYQSNKPKPAEGHMNNLKVVYSSKQAPKGSGKINNRIIPQVPERILDCPDLLDDYYLNLIHWSCNNHLAVALRNAVYIWNASSGSIMQLTAMEEPEEYVSCVKWVKEGNILAVGTSAGNVELWDVDAQKMMRTMTGHAGRVGSMDWNSYVCSSGSRTGNIHHHDVRTAEHLVATLANHTQEVCGLSWSPDGRYLASGGNDNIVNIWNSGLGDDVVPVLTFTHHQAAVKALSWCPWQHHVLATGGGTADRHIRLWNINTGSPMDMVDAQSQVCSILWSQEYKELISGHGFSQNQLTIWKYPDMYKVTDLTGHRARVLGLSMSPDGTTVASAAADETIRLWKCFAVNKQKTTALKPVAKTGANIGLMKAIR